MSPAPAIQSTPSSRNRAPADAPALPPIPFAAAAHEHTEPAFDVTVTPGATVTNITPQNVPAYGYIRHLVLQVDATGGDLGAGALSADFPWNIFSSIQLSDVNGAPVFGPLSGYSAFVANLLGAYAGRPDPRAQDGYAGTINTSYILRIPIEIAHRDGFGSLANQNAAAAYRVSLAINPSTTIFATAPTTVPAVRVRGFLEAWTLPNEISVQGRPQEQLPPAHGTTQYWSSNTQDVTVGGVTIPIVRVGNLIRTIAVVARTSAGARSDAVFADPATLSWDARAIRESDTQRYLRAQLAERIPDLVDRPAGVFAWTFNASDHNQLGDDAPTFWLPTVQSSRLEIDGTVATAGTWEVITNDIAPAEVVPTERFVETSRTGLPRQA